VVSRLRCRNGDPHGRAKGLVRGYMFGLIVVLGRGEVNDVEAEVDKWKAADLRDRHIEDVSHPGLKRRYPICNTVLDLDYRKRVTVSQGSPNPLHMLHVNLLTAAAGFANAVVGVNEKEALTLRLCFQRPNDT
jgi:hypothetical protein